MLKKILLLVMPVLAFAACNLSSTMLVTPAKQEVPAAGGTFTISLITTDEDPSWTAECDSAWITINPTSGKGDGKITVTVAKNPRMVARSAAIAIRGKSSSVFSHVLQEANDKDETGGNNGGGNGGDNGGNGGDNGGTKDAPYFDLGYKKVVFAPGNLQYCASRDEWRFAEHQYDMVGYDNDKISQTYSGYIDLFGWGTSGYNSCMPYLTTTDDYQYGSDAGFHFSSEYARYDWGIYNSSRIKNNPDPSYQWQVLNNSDWKIIFNYNRHTLATVCGVPGVLIFPAGFEVDENEISYDDYLHKVVKDEKYLTDNGLVFLPAAGYREGTTCARETTGWYHTASDSGGTSTGCVIVKFYSSRDDKYGNGNIYINGDDNGRHYGCAVRLVREVK